MIEPLGGPAYWLPYVIAFVIAYLIGSVPFGVILTRLGGAGDLRQIGSGNIGATNVLRTGRKGLALATLALDVLKGALPVWLGGRYFGPDIAVIAGLGAVLGHCFPVWLEIPRRQGRRDRLRRRRGAHPAGGGDRAGAVRRGRAADPLRLARLDPRRGRDRPGGLLARPLPAGPALSRAGGC